MPLIKVLDSATIDKIAAGEVVEKPASVAKELVENAIDAGSKSITVEIKDGGISLLRVSDNGAGIPKDQVDKAFLRHATSKIDQVEDLDYIETLGFRGEALASIAAVAMVEMITKVKEDLTGTRYVIEGGIERSKEEIGAPDGTTIIVRNLFFNVPARKKFLKKPQTEGSYIADMMEHMALSHPEISFRFIQNNQVRFSTAGNGNLKEVIYRIFGKEMSENIKEASFENKALGVSVTGFIGVPGINRSNRNYEIFYVNNRYIKSELLSKALEEGYREYLMQHKFPVCILHFHFEPGLIDVNVHPTKMEVRITDGQSVYEFFAEQIHAILAGKEMIPEVAPGKTEYEKPEPVKKHDLPELFEVNRIAKEHISSSPYAGAKTPAYAGTTKTSYTGALVQSQTSSVVKPTVPVVKKDMEVLFDETDEKVEEPEGEYAVKEQAKQPETNVMSKPEETIPTILQTETKTSPQPAVIPVTSTDEKQMNLFEEKIVSASALSEYKIIGQIFKTYWLITYRDKLLIIDQHAAHEKVKYERLIKQLDDKDVPSQNLIPPVVLSLSRPEAELLKEHMEHFEALGFAIEPFGGNEYALRSVPLELYGNAPNELLLDMLEDIQNEKFTKHSDAVRNRIATMACKAAVKGNQDISLKEMEQLLEELMTLDNPYHCPHGRPTIISMTKSELEKKFKRIV